MCILAIYVIESVCGLPVWWAIQPQGAKSVALVFFRNFATDVALSGDFPEIWMIEGVRMGCAREGANLVGRVRGNPEGAFCAAGSGRPKGTAGANHAVYSVT